MAEPNSPPPRGSANAEDLTGTHVGRFIVRARLGAGGMGEVYRADDTKLKRSVALKRVAPARSGDTTYRQRFLKEAERASALSNQHIAAVYDVLEENGELFLVMEYVEGETLRQRMKHPLTEKEFYGIAFQCAEALAEAHGKGIVHRDIKPENIMLTAAGRVKILDFGVARRIPRPESVDTTETSDSVSSSGFSGTPAYMAPEVLLEQDADGRADLFSLGVVLYEALTGQHPFRAQSFMATCDRILREAPAPITQINPQLSPAVEQLLTRMMAKLPAERHTGATELIDDLKRAHGGIDIPDRLPRPARVRWIAGTVAGMALLAALTILGAVPSARQKVKNWFGLATLPPTKHLAVLPFEAVGGDPRSKAFCDGLVATVTAKLTQLTERRFLQVVPASEVHAAGVSGAEQARQQLGVNLVLTGTLHQSGEQMRVSYALVDTATRRQLDAVTVTASLANPFDLEDRVVSGVLRMLEVELRPAEQRAFTAHGTQVAGAFDFYLQGRGYLENYDRAENIDNAIRVFEQALRLDSQYALAHAGLGEAYWRQYETTSDARWVAQAQTACQHGLALDPDLATARTCLGMLLNGTGQHEKALAEWRRAVELEPTSDRAQRGLGFSYEKLGRLAEAEQTYQRAIALRPHYWGGYNRLGSFYFSQARYAEASEQFQQVVALAPDSFQGYSNVGAAFYALDRFADAIQMFEKSIAIRPTNFGYSNLATVYFQMRRFEDSSRTFEKALALDNSDYVLWGNLGDACHFVPGKEPRAVEAWRRAITLAEARLRVNQHDATVLADLANYHAALAEREKALGYLKAALDGAPGNPDVRFKAALVHNLLGETEAALTWLEKALKAGYSASLIRDNAFFLNLRPNPRFEQVLRAHLKS